MKQRLLIFTGGRLGSWALQHIRDDDLLIGADYGALFLIRHGRVPHMALGDFDSVSDADKRTIRQSSIQYQECDPVHKDWTDTELALNWAIEQAPAEIVIIGALGTRFDHSLANVHLLVKAKQAGIPCVIQDEYNRIILVDGYAQIQRDEYPYVSLLPLSEEVTGVTLEGFQYPLTQAALHLGETLGISNVLIADTGHIHTERGQLLCIQSKD